MNKRLALADLLSLIDQVYFQLVSTKTPRTDSWYEETEFRKEAGKRHARLNKLYVRCQQAPSVLKEWWFRCQAGRFISAYEH